MLNGKIKPLYNDEILDEYFDVLNRSKFHLTHIAAVFDEKLKDS